MFTPPLTQVAILFSGAKLRLNVLQLKKFTAQDCPVEGTVTAIRVRVSWRDFPGVEDVSTEWYVLMESTLIVFLESVNKSRTNIVVFLPHAAQRLIHDGRDCCRDRDFDLE